MQLTLHTDYALRVLIYLSVQPGKTVTIDEVTEFYGISRNHLVKVVHHLSGKNFINTTRGKNGGMQLSKDPNQISIGDVVREMEANFNIVECFDPGADRQCSIAPICALKTVLQEACDNFLLFLDQYTLEDALTANANLKKVIPASILTRPEQS